MERNTAILDASVLYSSLLRDILMELTVADFYLARWTDDIHGEWTSALMRDRPELPVENINRTRFLMDHHARDANVTGYADRIAGLYLPDPDDRHVLAAAIHCGAVLIITFNLRDFPADSLASYGLRAQHPDDFLKSLLDVDGDGVVQAVQVARRRLVRPPISASEYLAALERLGLVETVAGLRVLGFDQTDP